MNAGHSEGGGKCGGIDVKKRSIAPHQSPQLNRLTLAVALAFAFGDAALALPQGEKVVAGQVSVARPAAGKMLIQQGSASGIVNWSGFSIAGGEAVRIQQPQASSVLLNRVVGSQASEIFGQLSANGKVFLLNPNGVLFGAGSQVDVGSLVASTLAMSDQDFLAGRYRFAGGRRQRRQPGTITAADRGTVALLGGTVRNDGRIEARLGTVALAAGSQLTLDLAGDGLSRITVTQAAIDAHVANGGAIVADGGAVLLTASALNALVGDTVNHSGVVRARSLVERNGRIVLDAGDSGTTIVSGALDTSGSEAGRAVAKSRCSAAKSVSLALHYSMQAQVWVAAMCSSVGTFKARIRACATRQPRSLALTLLCVPTRQLAEAAAR